MMYSLLMSSIKKSFKDDLYYIYNFICVKYLSFKQVDELCTKRIDTGI